MGARAEDSGVRRPLPWLHTHPGGTPYFDEDLQVAQLKPHRIMVSETTPILTTLADEIGILFLSDEPIWYLHPETDEQKVFFGDLVLAHPVDHMRITSSDLLLAIEVVSTHDRRKELKDTRFQRLLNEYNGVPEFALVFPDVDDPRALTWFRLEDGQYAEEVVVPGARASSSAVPGLQLRVRPRDVWEPGYKIDVFYRGELRPRLAGERARAEEQEARAEREQARAEREQARADALEARLRELGLDETSEHDDSD